MLENNNKINIKYNRTIEDNIEKILEIKDKDKNNFYYYQIIQRNIPPKKNYNNIIENNISKNFKILAYHLNIIIDQIILNFQ